MRQDNSGKWYESGCHFRGYGPRQIAYAPPNAVVNDQQVETSVVLGDTGYDEVYYVLAGTGKISLGQETHPLRPGSVAVIPAGVPHSLGAEPGKELEFVIFGTPQMAMEDERARPVKPVG